MKRIRISKVKAKFRKGVYFISQIEKDELLKFKVSYFALLYMQIELWERVRIW